MTDTATTTPAAHTAHRRHPTPKQYWQIAGVLGVITGIEVAASYIDGLRGVVVPVLIFSAVLKFAIVAGWFMHLRFDKPQYTRFFLIGIIGAILLFTVMLLTFGLLVGS